MMTIEVMIAVVTIPTKPSSLSALTLRLGLLLLMARGRLAIRPFLPLTIVFSSSVRDFPLSACVVYHGQL